MKVVEGMKTTFESDLFGKEKDQSFRSSCAQIYQTFNGHDLYPSLEEKAAMLLYFVVKNHSFVDGNKRIGAVVFLYFLNKNHILYSDKGAIIDNQSLAALTLLIAESDPLEKELVKKITVSLLNRGK